ncbi:MAG: hypothetical protein JXA10_19770 [Anaerolineae bacterium]|nr:hypothetical protein [Anaerolineae bacterium]
MLRPGRKLLGFGSDLPMLKCEHCRAVAFLDVDPDYPDSWRILYRRFDQSPRYYYVALYLGQAGWLSANEALTASTNGYVQRARLAQTRSGDLTWLRPGSLRPPPPMMTPDEKVYLTLRAVTLQETPPPGFLVRPDHGTVLDSGKLYITDQKLHLLGQRHDWSYDLTDIQDIKHDDKAWLIYLADQHHVRGLNVADQFDAQLITAVVKALCQSEFM